MNPYRLFLGDQRAVDVIQGTPVVLQQLTEQFSASDWDQSYAPGKWTARQIVCHLADTEIAFSFRLRQAAAEQHHIIQPFDQDAWSAPYQNFDGKTASETFGTLRRWNLLFIGTLSPELLLKAVTHPERGPMTIEIILETMGGHDRNHLAQLETIRANQLHSA